MCDVLLVLFDLKQGRAGPVLVTPSSVVRENKLDFCVSCCVAQVFFTSRINDIGVI